MSLQLTTERRALDALFVRTELGHSQHTEPWPDVIWYTWSPRFRASIRDLLPELRRLGAPPLVRVPGLNDYDWSYSICPHRLRPPLQHLIYDSAEALGRTEVPNGLVLLDSMLSDGFGTHDVRTLLALLRGALVDRASDECAALYAPLGHVGPKVGEFALHSDLYVPDVLLNIFDRVPDDGSGSSVFFPAARLPGALEATASLPADQRERILELMKGSDHVDHFNDFYDLLHGPTHPWTSELGRILKAGQLRARLNRGQGYLIDDRAWLHGRETPSNGVPENRVHRLAFRSRSSRNRNTERS